MKHLSPDDPRRAEAERLRRAGYSVHDICVECGIGSATAKRWLDGVQRGAPVKRQSAMTGSGIIAPAPYARGLRWPARYRGAR